MGDKVQNTKLEFFSSFMILSSAASDHVEMMLLEYPEKRHCCSYIVYAWIPTVSGGHPSGEDRGPLDVWASVATHSSVFNTDDHVQLP